MEARINELEVKLAFAEDLLEALNQTVFKQQQQIDLLHVQMKQLREQMANVAPGDGARSLRDEIPPHY